jgi:hypothetical protein
MTQACMAAIRHHTHGVAYEIVLLDNGSVSNKAEEFITNQESFPNTTFCGLSSGSITRRSIILVQNHPIKNFCCF